MHGAVLRCGIAALVLSFARGPLLSAQSGKPSAPGRQPEKISAQATSASEPYSFEHARALAFGGKEHRAETLNYLKAHLEKSPDDNESRILYGTVLSWDGRYNEAHKQLEMVLAKNPTNSDALPALINVDLWWGYPAEAVVLARRGLAADPKNETYLVDEARALHDLGDDWEANKVYSKALSFQPLNAPLRESVWSFKKTSGEYWEFSVDHIYTAFNKIYGDQNETTFSARGATPIGSVTFRENQANRFHLTGYQSEVDFWPGFGQGTYGYLNLGYSNDVHLFPRWRMGAELFHDTHGFEFSGGYRYLHFSSTDVNIYTFSVGKYHRDWFFDERTFLTPGNTGWSNTEVFSARRFFSNEGLHDYAEFSFSRGASPAQATTVLGIDILNSYKGTVTVDKTFGHFALAASASVAQTPQNATFAKNLLEYTLDGAIYYRF